MKYRSVNNLNEFEFHDAQMENVSFDGDILTGLVECLNIRKETGQNPSDRDMEIAKAKLTISGIRKLSFEVKPSIYSDRDGKERIEGQHAVWEEDEAGEKLADAARYFLRFYYLEVSGGNRCYAEVCGQDDPYFILRFSFDTAVVEWDDYAKQAWYEDDKWRNASEQ